MNFHPNFIELQGIRLEKLVAYVSLGLLMLLPVIDSLLRIFFRISIPDGSLLIRHLVLPVAFLGASLASKNHEHLGIHLGIEHRKDWLGNVSRIVPLFFSGMFLTIFFFAAISSVLIFPEFLEFAWFIPLAVLLLVIPLGFLLIFFRTMPVKPGWKLGFFLLGGLLGILYSLADIRDILGFLGANTTTWKNFDFLWAASAENLRYFILIPLILSAFLGTPLFIVLGGAAVLLYTGQGFTLFGESMGASPVIGSGYTLITQDMVPAIALFTLAGFILSSSQTGERFIRLFKSFFGGLPGGIVVIVVLVSAFFTTFTGASGVTILALGGLLHTILSQGNKGNDRFSVGLITASGSAGILFPPSLAIILYGSIAMIPIDSLFVASLLPGAVMLVAVILAGVIIGRKHHDKGTKFSLKEAFSATLESLPELAVPGIIAALFFSGFATVGETAAWAALYVFVLEVFIRKEISPRDLKKLLNRTLVIVGGVLIILGVARGLSSWLVENGIADLLSQWFASNVQSPLMFLLILNLLLLVVGCFMDLFSAILVVVPILIPVAAVYGINPLHMAVIFLSNMGVGFITPPVGMNLFLASYRFERPLVKIFVDVVPFLAVQLLVVLLITYVPLFFYSLAP